MKISFSTLACPDWDLDRILAAAVDYGYDGVDFRGLGAGMNICELPAFSSDAEATAKRFADAGVEISGFSSSARMFSPDPASRQGHLDEVARYAELCGRMAVPMIRVFGGPMEGADHDEAVTVGVETLERMAELASPVSVLVETHDDWVDSSLLARVFKRAGAENVGVLWDLNHPYRKCGEMPDVTYANIGRYTRCVHVKDSIVSPEGKETLVLPGEGDVPLAEMVGLLRDGGYDGYLTLEWEKRWHKDIAEPEVALPAWAEFLRRLA